MGNHLSHPSLPAPSAWSDSQLDVCLDQLGTAEGVVQDQEVELAVLRAALMALSSPWVIVGLAAGFSLLAVFEVARLIWYLCTVMLTTVSLWIGSAAGSFVASGKSSGFRLSCWRSRCSGGELLRR